MIDEAEELQNRIDDFEEVLERLVNEYVANRGMLTRGEFICCITPPHRASMGSHPTDRANLYDVWNLWDKARRLLGENVPPLPTQKQKWINGVPQPVKSPR